MIDGCWCCVSMGQYHTETEHLLFVVYGLETNIYSIYITIFESQVVWSMACRFCTETDWSRGSTMSRVVQEISIVHDHCANTQPFENDGLQSSALLGRRYWRYSLIDSFVDNGWWFQTFGLFSISYMGCHPSHWRTPSFFKMVIAPPTRLLLTIINHIITINNNH